MDTMTTGQLAKSAGVSIETVRYYEKRGLIPRPQRRESGYREYSDVTVQQIRFIKHAKELGFSLKEIGELLSLKVDPETPCSEVRKRAELKIADIDGKISRLRRIKKALARLTAACSGKGPASKCPILDAMEK